MGATDESRIATTGLTLTSQPLRCQRHFAGDTLAGALHHERQRHNMGLTIHCERAAYPNFEHLEAEGQRLLPVQLKPVLKAFGQRE